MTRQRRAPSVAAIVKTQMFVNQATYQLIDCLVYSYGWKTRGLQEVTETRLQ